MDATHQDEAPTGTSRRPRAAVEAEIASLAARVEELERERPFLAEFAALAAHEVLKPLMMSEASAIGILDRTGAALDADARDDLAALATASSQARRLVETLLADAQHSGQPLERTPVELARVVQDCLLALRPELAARRIDVEVTTLPMVPGNAVLLRGVFMNLLMNALEHGARFGSVIRISCTEFRDAWRFDVDSAGPPIPEEDRERIFEPLRRGSLAGRGSGVGLGLTLVRRIVERHGGHVGVTSPDGWSNRFSFTLPA